MVKQINIGGLPQVHLLPDVQKHGRIRLCRHGRPGILTQQCPDRKRNAAADQEIQGTVRYFDSPCRNQHPEKLHSAKQQQRCQQQNVSSVKYFHSLKSSSDVLPVTALC